MRSKQTGITFWSFLLIAVVAVIIGFAALKLTPVYLEYMRVNQMLNDLKKQYDGQEVTVAMIQTAISKRLEIEAVGQTDTKDFEISKTEDGIEVRAQYQRTVPYLANLSLLASFDKAVEIRR
jgi:uncharacterized membrane-anchored protein YhcB (DUF1043 family)